MKCLPTLSWAMIGASALVVLAALVAAPFWLVRAPLTSGEHPCFVQQRAVLRARAAYLRRHRMTQTDPVYVTNLVQEFFLTRMPSCGPGGDYGALLTAEGLLDCRYPGHDFAHFTNDLASRGIYAEFERLLNHSRSAPPR